MTETFKVAGVTYYEDNIRQLGTENDEYDYSNRELKDFFDDGDRINEYEFDLNMLDVELIPEPDNAFDPNAV